MIDAITQMKGLVRQYNPLSTAPGALSKANDCVIRRENIIEDRRGFKRKVTIPTYDVNSLFNYEGTVYLHNSNNQIGYYNGASMSYVSGSFVPWSDQKVRGIEAYQNLYLNTSTGVKVLENKTTGVNRSAGAPRSLDASYALTATASGFLTDTYQCAYRTLIKKTDTNKNIIFGYPSQRIWVVNASGNDENVTLTITLANDVVSGDVLQVYRTSIVSTTSSDISGDEMGLVYEYTISSSDVTTGEITFTDSITDALIGATLYISPSQEGIAQGNIKPPSCKDIALYKSAYMFYANTRTDHQLNFSIVGTGALSGKYLTIAGIDYEFGATEIISGAGSPQAKVSATGVAAVDIDKTSRSLVRVINRYALNTSVYAYYLSGPDDLPGQILLQVQNQSSGEFSVLAEDTAIGVMTFPESPVGTASDAMTSTDDTRLNGLYYSKNQQPEAVPLLNYLPVGPANKKILRIAPLRDSLIIISEGGVYRLTGEDPASFTVTTLDDTIRCKALETVRVLSNQVIMLSNQGVVRISENGVEVISREIEIEVSKILNYGSYEDYTRASVYESERSYLLSSISDSTKTTPDITFVYNLFTSTWVKWTVGMESAIVEDSSDKLNYTDGSSDLFVERKDFTNTDFADPEYNVTIIALSGATVTVTTSVVPQIGWVLSQTSISKNIISVSVVSGGFLLTFAQDVPSSWSAAAADLFPSVDMDIEFMSWNGRQPAVLKQVRSVALLTDDTQGENTVTFVDYNFKSNFDNRVESVTIERPEDGWGAAWGLFPWGGGNDSFNYPTWVPMNKQYCNRLFVGFRHRSAFEKLAIAGVAIEYEMVSEEVGT